MLDDRDFAGLSDHAQSVPGSTTGEGGIGNRTGWTDSVTFCSVLSDCIVHLLSFVTAKNTAECRLWMENADGERWVVGMASVELSNLPVWLRCS